MLPKSEKFSSKHFSLVEYGRSARQTTYIKDHKISRTTFSALICWRVVLYSISKPRSVRGNQVCVYVCYLTVTVIYLIHRSMQGKIKRYQIKNPETNASETTEFYLKITDTTYLFFASKSLVK